MGYRIRISREWGCSPLGGQAVTFAAGEYHVPDEISDFLAQRCLRSGRAILLDDDADIEPPRKVAPTNKMRGKAPENKSREA